MRWKIEHDILANIVNGSLICWRKSMSCSNFEDFFKTSTSFPSLLFQIRFTAVNLDASCLAQPLNDLLIWMQIQFYPSTAAAAAGVGRLLTRIIDEIIPQSALNVCCTELHCMWAMVCVVRRTPIVSYPAGLDLCDWTFVGFWNHCEKMQIFHVHLTS